MTTTTINLLPWREERRKQQQQDFMILLGVAAVLAAIVWFVWDSAVSSDIANQRSRNQYVEKELSLLESQIKEIKELEDRRAELVSQLGIIQDLQNSRPSIVYIFDQLVRTLPDGVYYKEISRKGREFTITGIAESNNRISSLMRNLNESAWFQNPVLKTVNAVGDDTEANSFVLTVAQESQQEASAGEGTKANGARVGGGK
ncbi:MAG: PilN domain-containing protein [Alcanivoracaceae bacterium]|nr:PilN domain-containing protein [Alcanivoracaceae bacterium]